MTTFFNYRGGGFAIDAVTYTVQAATEPEKPSKEKPPGWDNPMYVNCQNNRYISTSPIAIWGNGAYDKAVKDYNVAVADHGLCPYIVKVQLWPDETVTLTGDDARRFILMVQSNKSGYIGHPTTYLAGVPLPD